MKKHIDEIIDKLRTGISKLYEIQMIIGVPKEIKLQEHRIGLTPESVKALTEKGHEVLIQRNGGFEAGFSNEDYENSGAKIIDKAEEILRISRINCKS